MSKAQNRITVLDVIQEIHRQATELVTLKELRQEDQWRLSSLHGAIAVLIETAGKMNNLEFNAVLGRS